MEQRGGSIPGRDPDMSREGSVSESSLEGRSNLDVLPQNACGFVVGNPERVVPKQYVSGNNNGSFISGNNLATTGMGASLTHNGNMSNSSMNNMNDTMNNNTHNNNSINTTSMNKQDVNNNTHNSVNNITPNNSRSHVESNIPHNGPVNTVEQKNRINGSSCFMGTHNLITHRNQNADPNFSLDVQNMNGLPGQDSNPPIIKTSEGGTNIPNNTEETNSFENLQKNAFKNAQLAPPHIRHAGGSWNQLHKGNNVHNMNSLNNSSSNTSNNKIHNNISHTTHDNNPHNITPHNNHILNNYPHNINYTHNTNNILNPHISNNLHNAHNISNAHTINNTPHNINNITSPPNPNTNTHSKSELLDSPSQNNADFGPEIKRADMRDSKIAEPPTDFAAPNFAAPNFAAPNFAAPNLAAPNYAAPNYEAPNPPPLNSPIKNNGSVYMGEMPSSVEMGNNGVAKLCGQNMPSQNMPSQNMPGQNMRSQNMPSQKMPIQTPPNHNMPIQSPTNHNMPIQNMPSPQNPSSQSTPCAQSVPPENVPPQTGETMSGYENLNIDEVQVMTDPRGIHMVLEGEAALSEGVLGQLIRSLEMEKTARNAVLADLVINDLRLLLREVEDVKCYPVDSVQDLRSFAKWLPPNVKGVVIHCQPVHLPLSSASVLGHLCELASLPENPYEQLLVANGIVNLKEVVLKKYTIRIAGLSFVQGLYSIQTATQLINLNLRHWVTALYTLNLAHLADLGASEKPPGETSRQPDVRGDPRGDIKGDMRGDIKSDMREDMKGDVRGNKLEFSDEKYGGDNNLKNNNHEDAKHNLESEYAGGRRVSGRYVSATKQSSGYPNHPPHQHNRNTEYNNNNNNNNNKNNNCNTNNNNINNNNINPSPNPPSETIEGGKKGSRRPTLFNLLEVLASNDVTTPAQRQAIRAVVADFLNNQLPHSRVYGYIGALIGTDLLHHVIRVLEKDTVLSPIPNPKSLELIESAFQLTRRIEPDNLDKSHKIVDKTIVEKNNRGEKNNRTPTVKDGELFNSLKCMYTVLSPGDFHGHTVILYKNIAYYLGGKEKTVYVPLDVAHLINVRDMSVKKLSLQRIPPPPRSYHTANLVRTASHTAAVLVFGGSFIQTGKASKTTTVLFNDVHLLDLQSHSWQKITHTGTPPAPRDQHTAAVFPPRSDPTHSGGDLLATDFLFVFGGRVEHKAKNIISKENISSEANNEKITGINLQKNAPPKISENTSSHTNQTPDKTNPDNETEQASENMLEKACQNLLDKKSEKNTLGQNDCENAVNNSSAVSEVFETSNDLHALYVRTFVWVRVECRSRVPTGRLGVKMIWADEFTLCVFGGEATLSRDQVIRRRTKILLSDIWLFRLTGVDTLGSDGNPAHLYGSWCEESCPGMFDCVVNGLTGSRENWTTIDHETHPTCSSSMGRQLLARSHYCCIFITRRLQHPTSNEPRVLERLMLIIGGKGGEGFHPTNSIQVYFFKKKKWFTLTPSYFKENSQYFEPTSQPPFSPRENTTAVFFEAKPLGSHTPVPCILLQGGKKLKNDSLPNTWIFSLTGEHPFFLPTLNAQPSTLKHSYTPSVLWSLCSEQRWVLGATAHFVDNSSAPHVRAKNIYISFDPLLQKDGVLSVRDDGVGVDSDCLNRLLRLYGTYVPGDMGRKNFEFGLGFKSGVARLGFSCAVMSRTLDTVGVGLLSQPLLAQCESNQLATPLCIWKLPNKELVTKYTKQIADHKHHQKLLMTYTPFTTPTLLAEQINVLGTRQGTRLLFWNMRTDMDFLIPDDDLGIITSSAYAIERMMTQELWPRPKQREIGENSAENGAKIGENSAENVAKIDENSAQFVAKIGANSAENVAKIGENSAENVAKIGENGQKQDTQIEEARGHKNERASSVHTEPSAKKRKICSEGQPEGEESIEQNAEHIFAGRNQEAMGEKMEEHEEMDEKKIEQNDKKPTWLAEFPLWKRPICGIDYCLGTYLFWLYLHVPSLIHIQGSPLLPPGYTLEDEFDAWRGDNETAYKDNADSSSYGGGDSKDRNSPEKIEQNIPQQMDQNIPQKIDQKIPQQIDQNISQQVDQSAAQNIDQNIVSPKIEQHIAPRIEQNIVNQNISQNMEQNEIVGQNMQSFGQNYENDSEKNAETSQKEEMRSGENCEDKQQIQKSADNSEKIEENRETLEENHKKILQNESNPAAQTSEHIITEGKKNSGGQISALRGSDNAEKGEKNEINNKSSENGGENEQKTIDQNNTQNTQQTNEGISHYQFRPPTHLVRIGSTHIPESSPFYKRSLANYVKNRLYNMVELPYVLKPSDSEMGGYAILGFLNNPQESIPFLDRYCETGTLLYFNERLVRRLEGHFPAEPQDAYRTSRTPPSEHNFKEGIYTPFVMTALINVPDCLIPSMTKQEFIHENNLPWFTFKRKLTALLGEYLSVCMHETALANWLQKRKAKLKIYEEKMKALENTESTHEIQYSLPITPDT